MPLRTAPDAVVPTVTSIFRHPQTLIGAPSTSHDHVARKLSRDRKPHHCRLLSPSWHGGIPTGNENKLRARVEQRAWKHGCPPVPTSNKQELEGPERTQKVLKAVADTGGERNGDAAEAGEEQEGGTGWNPFRGGKIGGVSDSVPPEGLILLLACLVGFTTGGGVVIFNDAVRTGEPGSATCQLTYR